jgi:hypothetical protein
MARRGEHGVVVAVRGDVTAEPPAPCRLVSDRDLFATVIYLDCTAATWVATAVPWEGTGFVESKTFRDHRFCSASSEQRSMQRSPSMDMLICSGIALREAMPLDPHL